MSDTIIKGSYVLLIELSQNEIIKIGRLGSLFFHRGFYAYTGSAMNGLKQRVNRHLKKHKKLHWHIDYLLQKAHVREVILLKSEIRLECKIARGLLKGFDSVTSFGCSDCTCKSHLFYGLTFEQIKSDLGKILNRLDCHPERACVSGL